MHYVYILQNINNPRIIYKGYSTDLKTRIQNHQQEKTKYAGKRGPWKLVFYSAFVDKYKALHFERYLKTSSGIAFLRKRLVEYVK